VLRRLSRVSGAQLARNILSVYARATAEERAEGLNWYRHAHGIACDIASRVGCTVQGAAGILAALSPSVAWETNVTDAYRLAADEPGAFSTYGPNVRKARAIRDGANPLDILGGPKVRAFYACILEPDSAHGTVCVDRHAVSVAFAKTLGQKFGPAYLALAGSYARVAKAYCAAAKTLGILPHQLQAITWVAWRNLSAAGQVEELVPF
jgi:hypothetical protein